MLWRRGVRTKNLTSCEMFVQVKWKSGNDLTTDFADDTDDWTADSKQNCNPKRYRMLI